MYRILHVLPYNGLAGTERCVLTICRAQKRCGGKPCVLLRNEGPLQRLFTLHGIESIVLRSQPDVPTLREIEPLATKFDIAHLHTCGSLRFMQPLLSLFKSRAILHLHWMFVLPRLRNCIICPTQAVGELQHPENRVEIIPNAVCIQDYYSTLSSVKSKQIVVVRLGRPEKFAPHFWNVVDQIIADGEVQIWIIGERGVNNNRVRYLGFVENVPELLANADVLFHPIYPEVGAQDLAVLEAQACGVVPVVSDVPAATPSIQHGLTGFIAPFNNAAIMAYYLKALIRDESLRSRLSKSCKELIGRHHSDALQVERLEALYADVLANNPVCRI